MLTKTQSIYNRNYKKIISLLGDFDLSKLGEYKKIEVAGFMPLSIEVIDLQGENISVISLMHYYVQNGDLMRDPDMEIRVRRNEGIAEVLSYRQDGLGIYQVVYPEEGYVNVKLRKELNKFLGQWLSNLKMQGFFAKAGVSL